jgi:uncharacterized protein (TIGR03084 family)
MDVLNDLAAEHAQLDAVLTGLEPGQWDAASAADGWTVADVVLHLAQTEEMVVASVREDMSVFARKEGLSVDEYVAHLVAAERGAEGEEVHQRWRKASAAALEALRSCPPDQRLLWATAPLSPRTLATTRIAEHWAHALDIDPTYQDSDRLRHIAWLAHRTLPYAFAVAGVTQHGPVYSELTAPSGTVWRFGDPTAPTAVTGSASEFCRVGARRLAPEKSSLTAEGPDAPAVLHVLRNYAA